MAGHPRGRNGVGVNADSVAGVAGVADVAGAANVADGTYVVDMGDEVDVADAADGADEKEPRVGDLLDERGHRRGGARRRGQARRYE